MSNVNSHVLLSESNEPSTVWLPVPVDEVRPPPHEPVRCDVAVIGGGLAGLSTAIHIRQMAPRLDVALFESGRIGYGASGLNSGQCAPRMGPAIDAQIRSLGGDTARVAYQYSLDAVAFGANLASAHGIDCDLESRGQWQVALRERDARTLERHAEAYRSLGFDVPLVSASDVRAALPDSNRVFNALAFPASLLNPGRLCIGLKRAALNLGVRIFEHARVTRWDRRTGAFDVHSVQASAPRVVLAVDGGVGQLDHFRHAVIPISAWAAVTRALAPDERAAIGWRQGQGLFDARPAFSFLRPLPDGRLLIGGRYRHARNGLVEADRRLVGRDLIEQLRFFLPSLRDVTAEAVWHGNFGCTLDEWPIVGPLDDDLRHWHIGASNGHGLALSLAMGRDLAAMLTGNVPLPPRPWIRRHAMGLPEPLMRVFLPLYLAWLERASRLTS
ncbi:MULTISPECIES: FAD-dependent oxidoreductase [unclassified Caballeronia]|uniref:NAD(P)/FAD-dependent oxidoreductase n=1 Tax=unclassified Caballeronia TaxID=2646786 RepID=UPI00285D1344|nr:MULTISPECIES: FAD-dependent oxidoreductase [unclassified Caballeronia]MDR5753957.1 FAD-dependent oxidoreductase [Caballeronia sp. LZ024]MDR5840336.1 FAD-dependent oxidoreductase [Caballeronia sp. LZ031]